MKHDSNMIKPWPNLGETYLPPAVVINPNHFTKFTPFGHILTAMRCDVERDGQMLTAVTSMTAVTAVTAVTCPTCPR